MSQSTKTFPRATRVALRVAVLAALLGVLATQSSAAGTWTTKAPMPTARGGLALGEVDGILYAIGSNLFAANEAYNPATNSWSTKAPIPNRRSLRGTNAAVVDGIIYVIGGNPTGYCSSTNEAYSPATNSWTTRASMPTARCHLSVAALNGRVYALGGTQGSGALSTLEIYNPVTNQWTTGAPMPSGRIDFAIGVVNDRLYAIGGLSNVAEVNVVESYNPVTNSWTTETPMPTRRSGLAVAAADGLLYAIGGLANSTNTYFATVESYDPMTGTWTAQPSLATPRGYLACGVVNGIVYAVGGGNSAGVAVATNEAFTPSAPSAGLVVPASVTQGCDEGASVATVNFMVQVTGNPPSTATLTVRDVTGNRTLLSAPAVVGTYGVGPNTFPLGASTVEAKVLDGTQVLASKTFAVQVEDTQRPTIAGAADQTLEATGPLTAITPALLGISATDACDPSPTIEVAPSALTLGVTRVTATARDASGNVSTSSFEVTVRDTTAPVFTVTPVDVERECTEAAGVTVAFDVLAIDLTGGVTIACSDETDRSVSPAGSTYTHGIHTVTCTATDGSGNAASVSFYVTVVDTGAPLLGVPGDITVATDVGSAFAHVTFVVTATDECDPTVGVTCRAPWGVVVSGDPFPVGLTEVLCTAIDLSGNEATASFRVLVQDREAPVITSPATALRVTDCSGSALTITPADLAASATDNYDPSPTLTCAPSSLVPGVTFVVLTATDRDGNSSRTSVEVTVLKGAFACQILRPLDGNVDNLIKPGQTLAVKVAVRCQNVFDAGVVATVERVESIWGAGTPIASETVEDSGASNDDGKAMRLADGFYIYNLSTKSWPTTSGARFRVTMKFAKVGHVDTFFEVTLKNR